MSVTPPSVAPPHDHRPPLATAAVPPPSRPRDRVLDALRRIGVDRASRRLLGDRLHVRLASWLFPPDLALSDYDALIEFIERHRLLELPGDFLEIGAYLGAGTRRLAALAARQGKRVHVVDVFDMDFETPRFWHLRNQGRDQWRVFRRFVRGLPNVVTHRMDSRLVEFPPGTRFAFAFIDGDHHPEHVRSDFAKAWPLLVPGGGLAFHDWGHPLCTDTIAEIVREHAAELEIAEPRPDVITYFVVKRGSSSAPAGAAIHGEP